MQQVNMSPTNTKRRGFFGDPGVLLVFLLTAIGIGGFMFWASTTKIAQGVTTGGQLSIDSRRKTVQHLEGGIIEEILIRDRQLVAAGDVMMILANANATARADQLINSIVARSFELQRIEAQLRGDARFIPTNPPLTLDIPQDQLNQAAFIQVKVFNDMQAAVDGQVTVLDARINTFQTEIAGREDQLVTLENTIALERSEVARLQPLVEDQLAQIGELTAVQRRLNDALNERSRITSQINTSLANIVETEEEKRQAQRQFIANLAPQLSTVRDALLEAQEELEANRDVLKRREILAPISGQILNLAYTTIGGVIAPGEPIMDIVPEDEVLYVEARISPIEIDSVKPGMLVNARFSSLDPVNPPEIVTTVTTVDSDVTNNPETSEQYFIARIDLPADEVEKLKADGDFIAGLPVEIFADIGKDRTPLSYIVQPLSEIIEKGLRGE